MKIRNSLDENFFRTVPILVLNWCCKRKLSLILDHIVMLSTRIYLKKLSQKDTETIHVGKNKRNRNKFIYNQKIKKPKRNFWELNFILF